VREEEMRNTYNNKNTIINNMYQADSDSKIKSVQFPEQFKYINDNKKLELSNPFK
jgi:hypothetical protein